MVKGGVGGGVSEVEITGIGRERWGERVGSAEETVKVDG